MRDIRLEELPFEFDGKTYLLRCNMNVLADVQNAHNGNIADALDSESAMQSVLEFTAAMMNDYADEMGWPERHTAKTVGRKLALYDLPIGKIMRLVTQAMTPIRAESPDETVSTPDTGETTETEPENSGN